MSKYHGHEILIEPVEDGWLARVDGEVRTVQSTVRKARQVAQEYIDAPKSGDCYDAAIATAEDLVEDHETVWICHGRPTGQGPIEGVIHGHAWVEVEQEVEIPDEAPDEIKAAFGGQVLVTVFDRSNGHDIVYPRELYYAIGRMRKDEVARYSLDNTYLYMEEFGHYGPWDE